MSLKVIGAGFGRTGTASLKNALELLLGGRCYHMSEVLGQPGHVDHWLDVVAGKPNWDAIFADYVATVDFPASNSWRELADTYPDAKIILSVRDPERWFESTQATIFNPELQSRAGGTKWGQMLKGTIDDHLGGDLGDREALLAAFQSHTKQVQDAFGPERLLTFEARQGWQPLCDFLGVPVPSEPYPNINSKEEFHNVIEMLDSPMGATVMDGKGFAGPSMHDEVF